MSHDSSTDGSNLANSERSNGGFRARNDAMDISPGSSTHERDRKGSYNHRDYRDRSRSRSDSPSRFYAKLEKRGGSRQGRRDRDSRDSNTPPYKQRSRNWASPYRRSGGGGGRGDRGRNESGHRKKSKERKRRDKRSRSRSRSRHRSPKRGSSKKSKRRNSSGSSSPDLMSSSLIGEIKKQHGTDIGSSKHKKKSRKRRKHSSSSSSSSGEVLDGPASSNGMNIPTPLPPPPPSFVMQQFQPMQFRPPVPIPAIQSGSYMFPPPPHPPTSFGVPPPPGDAASFINSLIPNIPPPPIHPDARRAPGAAGGVALDSLPMPPDSRRIASRPVIISRRGMAPRPNWGDADSWYKTTLADYEMQDQIGEGTYGQVYKALNKKTGEQVALKRVRLENEKEGFPITAVREIKILRQLNHKNVVRLIDIVLDDISMEELKKTRANFYLVFEYVDHDLIGLLESKELIEFSKEQICSLFKQLLEGLAYVHHTGFLHRDIKCSNILVNNKGELKIADLGLARLWQREITRLYTNRVITLWYRPPELLLGDECYGPAVDVWSAGCMLGELFTRKPIFNGNNELQQLDLIAKICGSPNPDTWPALIELTGWRSYRPRKLYTRRIREEFEHIMPRDAVDLLDKMLTMNPDVRISAKDALMHPWIRQLDNIQVPPLKLPKHQDCHEMWSKKQKRSARLGGGGGGTRRNDADAAGSSGSGHSLRATSHSKVEATTIVSSTSAPAKSSNGSSHPPPPPPIPPPPAPLMSGTHQHHHHRHHHHQHPQQSSAPPSAQKTSSSRRSPMYFQ